MLITSVSVVEVVMLLPEIDDDSSSAVDFFSFPLISAVDLLVLGDRLLAGGSRPVLLWLSFGE